MTACLYQELNSYTVHVVMILFQYLVPNPYIASGVLYFMTVGVTQSCFFMDTDEKTHSDIMQINLNSPRTLIYGVLPGTHVLNIKILQYIIICACNTYAQM